MEWRSYNTSKSEINAVKLANIDDINSVNKIRRYNFKNKILEFPIERSTTPKRLNLP